jgi:AcrR family transcriptional regulator
LPRAQDRRTVIIEKSAELFAEKGIAATTVREIGDAAGILSGSLYHHFESKEAIVDAIVSDYFTDLLARYEAVTSDGGTPSEQLRGLVVASLEWAAAPPQASELYQREMKYLQDSLGLDYVRDGVTQIRRTWLAVLEQGAAQGSFRSDIDPRVLYPLIRDGLWRSVEWFHPAPGYRVADLAADAYAFFHQALTPPATPDAPVGSGRPPVRRRRRAGR